MLSFVVLGPPRAKERARRGVDARTGVARWYTPARTASYEKSVGWAALASRNRASVQGVSWPLDGEYQIEISMFMPNKRALDIDNVSKAILDGCNTVLWKDDRQVTSLHVMRSLDRELPRVEVVVSTKTKEPSP